MFSKKVSEYGEDVTRVCIVEEHKGSVLAQVISLIGGEHGLNIVGNTCKLRGSLLFQVVDVEVHKTDSRLTELVKGLEALEGVLTCSIGAFSPESGKFLEGSAPVRLCIVNKNVPGVLGRILFLFAKLDLTVMSEVNRSRGDVAYSVFDLENKGKFDWNSVCVLVQQLDNVISCAQGSFKAGDLAKPRKSSNWSSSSSERGGSDRRVTVDPELLMGGNRDEKKRTSAERRRKSEVLVKEYLDWGSTSDINSISNDNINSVAGLTTSPGTDYYEGGSKETRRSRTLTLMNERSKLTSDALKMVIAMVGLPARGKSFTARKVQRFLSWRNSKCKIFNAGRYRRERTSSNSTRDLPQTSSSEVTSPVFEHLDETSTITSPATPPPITVLKEEEKVVDQATFFDKGNDEGNRVRQDAANRCLSDLLDYLDRELGSAVGIFDATNSTEERREWILRKCENRANVVFIEVICDDEEILIENLLSKIRNSPDFEGMDEMTALKDLQDRIANYEEVYEPITGNDSSYIKIYNLSSKILANRIYGRLARSLLPYMLSLHVGLRPIWFVRAGLAEASTPDFEDMIQDPSTEARGSKLSSQGIEFAKRLGRWIQTAVWVRDEDEDDSEDMIQNEMSGYIPGYGGEHPESALTRAFGSLNNLTSLGSMGSMVSSGSSGFFSGALTPSRALDAHREPSAIVRKGDGSRQRGAKLKVLCSTLPRAEQTAQIALRSLNEGTVAELAPMLNPLDKGELAGLSAHEIQEKYPDFHEIWSQDSYNCRFLGGESYYDLVTRLEPVLIEMEQQTAPVLVVSHVSCIQVLLAYYMGRPVQEAMKIKVPMHKVIQVTPTLGGGWELKEFDV